MGGVAVAARAGVHADAQAFVRRQAAERQVVEIDEAGEQGAGGVDLDGEARFGEVDLHHVRAHRETAPDLGDVLVDEVFDELLARVVGDAVGRIHEAQGRRRNHRLLHRHGGMTQRLLEEPSA